MIYLFTSKGSYSIETYIELDRPTDNKQYFNNLDFNITLADPYIIKEGSTYYVYSTECSGIKTLKSNNFKDWEVVATKTLDDVSGYSCFWAPAVYKYNGKYYMFYSAVKGSDIRDQWLAVSNNPSGPFIKTQKINSKVNMPIDADLLFDNGKIYLYTKSEIGDSGTCCNGPGTSIYVEDLNNDLMSVKDISGYPKKILTVSNNGWEKTLVEGSYIFKRNNKYYLMYSSNGYADYRYTIGYAVSNSPTGEFIKMTPSTGSPLLHGTVPNGGIYNSDVNLYGTGHNSMLYVSDDEMYVVYHSQKYTDNSFKSRKLSADYMGIDSRGNLYVNGPSTTIQPLPTGSSYLSKVAVSDYSVKVDGNNLSELKDNINYNVLNTSINFGKTALTPANTKNLNKVTIELNKNKSIEDIWLYGNKDGFGNATADVILNDKYIIKNINLGTSGTSKIQLPNFNEYTRKIVINFNTNVTLSEISLYSNNTKYYLATFKAGDTVAYTAGCTLNSTFCNIKTPESVSISGYDFKGWGTSKDCTSGLNPNVDYTLSSDVTLYACLVSNGSAPKKTTNVEKKKTTNNTTYNDTSDVTIVTSNGRVRTFPRVNVTVNPPTGKHLIILLASFGLLVALFTWIYIINTITKEKKN